MTGASQNFFHTAPERNSYTPSCRLDEGRLGCQRSRAFSGRARARLFSPAGGTSVAPTGTCQLAGPSIPPITRAVTLGSPPAASRRRHENAKMQECTNAGMFGVPRAFGTARAFAATTRSFVHSCIPAFLHFGYLVPRKLLLATTNRDKVGMLHGDAPSVRQANPEGGEWALVKPFANGFSV